MNHETLRVLAQYAVYLIIFMVVPLLVYVFSDRFSSQIDAKGYAVLFSAVALAGILLFVPAISIVAGTALSAIGVAWLTARYALEGLTVKRRIEPARLFPGEETSLELRIENHKLLPVASVSLTNPVHFGLMMPNERYDSRLDFNPRLDLLEDLRPAVVAHFGIGPFQSVTRRLRIKALHRGAYHIEPATLEAGDAFGIFRRQTTCGAPMQILVYPRLHRTPEVDLCFRETLGDAATRRWLVEDPTLIKGAREFRPGDTLRKIHWKATARTGDEGHPRRRPVRGSPTRAARAVPFRRQTIRPLPAQARFRTH